MPNLRDDVSSSGQPMTLRVAQMLVGALMLGLLAFSGVVAFLALSGLAPASGTATSAASAPQAFTNLLIGVMAAMTLACAIAGFVLRSVITTAARKQAEAGVAFAEPQLLARFQTATILRAALAEGPALFAAVIVLLTGDWRALFGAAFGLLMLAAIFPLRGRFENFVRTVKGSSTGI